MHGLIFGGVVDSEIKTSNKRSAGSHRIATHLRKNGVDVEVIDFVQYWTVEQLQDLFKLRYRKDTIFVGISATFDAHFPNVREFLSWIKEHYPSVSIVGGTQSYYNCADLPIDWLIHGYGEFAMDALLRHLTNVGTDLKYSRHGYYNYIDAQHDYNATTIKDLSIIYEERDFIDSKEVLVVELGRGCIFNCGFCTLVNRNIKGDHSRAEGPLYDELLRNYESWGTENYTFADETVNDYTEKLYRYANVVQKLPFRPNFSGYARADLLVSRPDDWNMIWDLGFTGHFYGIESFNQKAGKVVGKGMNPEKLKDGLLKFRDYFNSKGFYRGHINLIAGLPGDTPDTLRETKKWIDEYWYPHDNANMAPLWIPTEAAREYDEKSEFSKDPGKWGYKRTSMAKCNPNNDEFPRYPYEMYWMLYHGLVQQDKQEVIKHRNPKAGGAKGVTFLNWENEYTNAYEMLLFMQNDWGWTNEQPPSVFAFHRHLINPSLKLQDMKRTVSDLPDNEPIRRQFVEEYINKKLNI